jgi:alpha-glucosidase (family GH31 glycosyl hydrolase)
MKDSFSRRDVIAGMGIGLAELLFAKNINAAGFFAPTPASEAGAANGSLTLVAFSDRILRVRVVPLSKLGPASELGIVPRETAKLLDQPKNADGSRTVIWGTHKIQIQEGPLRLTITDAGGKVCQELRFDAPGGSVHFSLGEGPIYGMGEGGHPFNRRGTTDTMRNGQHRGDLATYGARVPIPWLIGTEGWGLFFSHPTGAFDLTGEQGLFTPSPDTPTRDIFVLLADAPSELMGASADLTGHPHMPPLWSLGFQQSHRTLESRAEILEECKTFREKKLPCDAMIYLGTGFCPSGWNTEHGSFTFNPAVFPDPAAMIKQMHEEHFKVIVHVVSPPEDLHGSVKDTGAAAEDPSNAAKYWLKHKEVHNLGVDAWWPDEGDELLPPSRLARNQMYWEGSQLFQPNVRPFSLHRNGYAGMQRYVWLWSGDTLSTWKTLAAQIMVGITTGLSGIPYWGTDTGGFVPTKELTAELFVRWFQFSAFCPSFRCHGRTWKLRLPWGWNLGNYGPAELDGQFITTTLPTPEELHNTAVEGICRKYLNLRYQLLPYLYSTVAETHETGLPIMRALWIYYPQDPKATATDDAYMWGSSILVAPVIEKGASQRTTYLPSGQWWDFWTQTKIDGGKDVMRDVDLETMPLYVKAGSILPIGPIKQYADEKVTEPLTLKVYPGADGKFSLYEDDGITYGYEHGDFTRLECAWNDQDRTLSLKTKEALKKPALQRPLVIEVVGIPGNKKVTMNSRETLVRF